MAATVNLRTFPEPKQFECPHCHTQVTLYDPLGSEYVVCTGCLSYCRVMHLDHLQVQQGVQGIKYDQVIPVGKVGTLRDTPYKVIAYMEKKELAAGYEWCEYMLYSYTKGYAFLAEYDGHWTFIAGKQHFPEELKDASVVGSIATLGEADYQEYNRYTPVITALTGEFDWDAYEERVLTREFINPPWLAVREENKNERAVDWYLGEYMEPGEIAAAFDIPMDDFPETEDIGANQPNPYGDRWRQTLRISIAAAVLVILLQLLFGFFKQTQVTINKPIAITLSPNTIRNINKRDSTLHDSLKRDSIGRVASGSYIAGGSTYVPDYFNPNGNYEFQPVRTASFTIDHGPAPVEIDLGEPLDNNWFEATVELVSEKDNQTWDVTKSIEYYHGYDDGESWTEGSNESSAVIDNVPAGKYHLNIYPYAGTAMLTNISVNVTANVTLWQNIIITILLLSILPLVFWFLARRYEVRRWMNSDFSPYKKTDNE